MYEIDLKTMRRDVDDLFSTITGKLIDALNEAGIVERDQYSDTMMDVWCTELAGGLGLAYYRNDEWLCFCDSDVAPN